MTDRLATLQEIVNTAVARGARQVRTCIAAKIVKWDPKIQRAHCQILIKDAEEDEAGERVVHSLPVVTGVAVQYPGGNGFRVTFPIKQGTTGTLFFSHRSLDKWLSGKGGEVDPEYDHAHAMGDAIFMPGLNPFGAPLSSCPEDEASIGSDSDGNGRIHFQKDQVLLGDGASKQVARKGDGIKVGLAVTMGVGTLAASIAAITVTDPTTGLSNTLTTGNLTGDAAGEVIGGSAHVKAVD